MLHHWRKGRAGQACPRPLPSHSVARLYPTPQTPGGGMAWQRHVRGRGMKQMKKISISWMNEILSWSLWSVHFCAHILNILPPCLPIRLLFQKTLRAIQTEGLTLDHYCTNLLHLTWVDYHSAKRVLAAHRFFLTITMIGFTVKQDLALLKVVELD